MYLRQLERKGMTIDQIHVPYSPKADLVQILTRPINWETSRKGKLSPHA